MLIRFFKSSFYSQYLLLFIIAAALWTNAYFHPCSSNLTNTDSLLFTLLSGLIAANSIFSTVLAFVILLFSAIMLNFILIRHELLPNNSLLGALVYIVFMSYTNIALSLNPALVAGLFIIPAVDQIMLTYGKADPTQQVFTASFLLAIASLIYFPSILIILLLIISFVIFGTISFRILLVALVAAFSVYLYLFLYYFLTDSPEGQFFQYIEWFRSIPAFIFPAAGFQYVGLAFIILLFLIAAFFLFTHMNEWNISVRKKVLLNFWFTVLAISVVVYQGDNVAIALLIAMIPATMLISGFLAGRKRTSLLMEVYFLLLITAVFVGNTLFSTC